MGLNRPWELDNARLRELWGELGGNPREIALALGRSTDAVRSQADKLGLRKVVPVPHLGRWTAAVVEQVGRFLTLDGLTCAEIADKIAVQTGMRTTRNMIIGLATRHNLHPNRELTPKVSRAGKDSPARKNAVSLRKARQKAIAPAKPAKPVWDYSGASRRDPYETRKDAWTPILGSFPQPLTKLGRSCCKWPVGGAGADMLFCCEAVRGDLQPYCSAHHRLGVGETGSARDLARSIRKVA